MLKCRRFRIVFLVCVLGASTSCATTNLEPIGSGASSFRAEDDEKNLWQIAGEIEQRIAKKDLLYEDAELETYLNAVLARLFTDKLQGTEVAPRAKVIKHPFLNAFTLPHGAIYFHTGMLARMENEAQLATVMSHELIHFTHRHSARHMRSVQNKTAVVGVLQILLAGALGGELVGRLGTVVALASISGYSKDLETQADEEGFRLMIQAGYDPRESVKVFELLKQESDKTDIEEPFFFGTHPRIEERIKNNHRLLESRYQNAGKEADRRLNSEEFLARIHKLLLDNAILDLELGRFKIAEAAIERHLRREPDSPRGHYVMGELHRKSGRDDEAVEAYIHAAALDATYADPHRELGLIYRAKSRREEARAELEKYVALSPKAIDTPIIEGYVAELQNSTATVAVEK